jgi:hypothetical protein
LVVDIYAPLCSFQSILLDTLLFYHAHPEKANPYANRVASKEKTNTSAVREKTPDSLGGEGLSGVSQVSGD